MGQHIVAPVDGSPDSWKGAQVALTLARRLDASITVMTVVLDEGDRPAAQRLLERAIATDATAADDLDLRLEARVTATSVAAEIENVVEEHPGAAVVMASHGRGRSAAIVGSVADDVINRTFGPLLLVGPHVTRLDLDGPVVIAVDGSDCGERAVPLGVAWAIELGLVPWIVHAVPPDTTLPVDTLESGYVSGLAHRYRDSSGHEIEFDEIHGHRPATAVVGYADRTDAAMIVACTHARTGFERLTMGSVSSGFVRHATCPVLLVREPHLAPHAVAHHH